MWTLRVRCKDLLLSRKVSCFKTFAVKPPQVRYFRSTGQILQSYQSDDEDNYTNAMAQGFSATKVSNSLKNKNAPVKSEEEIKQTIFDAEKEMFQIRRQMTSAYSLGEYKLALDYAQDLLIRAEKLMGKRNAVYASCLNNVALMLKALGEQEKAMEKYVAALHVYVDIAGQNNTSYASALANIGVLYKEMSKGKLVKKDENDEQEESVFVPVKGLERLALLDRAEEALTEARSTRISLLGLEHKDSLYSSMHLASLLKMQNKPQEALVMLEEALSVAEEKYTKMDLICAALHNDLGVLHKSQQRYAEALTHYTQALSVRSNILGDTHNDTVVSTYNLAELYTAMGDTDQATKLQEEVVANLEQRNKRSNKSSGEGSAGSVGSESSSATQTKILEYSHTSKTSTTVSTSTSTTTTTATSSTSNSSTVTDPPSPMNAVADKFDAAKIVAQEQQTYIASTPDSEEERKRKLLAQTMATRPHKPATRRGAKKAV